MGSPIRHLRGAFLLLATLTTLISAAAHAWAANVKQVVVLETATLGAIQDRTALLLKHLGDLGYQPNHTLVFRTLNAEWDRERGERLLRKAIAERRPDLVVSVATLASQTARSVLRGTDIPQLFFFVATPKEAGLVDSVDGPTGTNVTGLMHRVPAAARLELAMTVLEGAEDRPPLRIGVLHSGYPSSRVDAEDLKSAANDRNDVTLVPLRVEAPSDADGIDDMIRSVLARMPEWQARVDAFWVAEGPMGRSKEFVAALSGASPRPVLAVTDTKTLCEGAVFAVSADAETESRETAHMARAILEGTPAGEIPIALPSEFQVAVNLAEAVRRGIVIPPNVLEVATLDACPANRQLGQRSK